MFTEKGMDIDGACMSSLGVSSERAGMKGESVDAIVEEIDDLVEQHAIEQMCCCIDAVKMSSNVL